MNVIMLREHNSVAKKLIKINPRWDDEKVFQTARTIMIGVFQHLCFKELISAYLGEDMLYKHELLHKTNQFIDDYDEEIDCGPLHEFAHVAFRQPHSMVNAPIL